MKKGFLKIVAVFMAVIMTAVYLPLSEINTVFDVEASAIVTNGKVKLGNNIKWTYDNKSKTITVSGSGAMYNYKNGDDGQRWDELILGLTHYPNKHAENLVIESGITSIGNNAFNGLKGIKKVTIPESVKTIGDSAFEGCSALTSVKLPSGVTVISNDTFYGCSSLSSVNINEGVTSIGANAFRDTKVSAVNMPYSVKSLGSNAFSTVKITCNYGDPAYNYCKSHANATAVLRAPSLRVEIAQGSAADLIKVSLYIQDASGFNAGNFTAEYNADIAPVSTDYTYSDNGGVTTAVVYGANNKISVAVAALTSVAYNDCTDKCSFKIAELSFRLNQGTHVAKITFSSSVLMLNNGRYSPASVFAEFGDHIFVPLGEPVAATCTEYGYTLKKCSICNEEREFDIVPALGHDYDDGVVTPPACEEGGYTSYTCSRCGDVRKDNFTDETGHTIKEVVVAATCKEKGKKTAVCETCKRETLIEEYEINPDNHVNTEIINAKDATCSENGYTGDTKCKDCGKIVATGSKTDTISHTYNSVVTAPTCTATGYTTHTCSVCGYTYKDSETPVVAHSYVKTVKKAATCKETGVAEYNCENCDASYTDDIPLTAHDYQAVVTAPTCQAGGYTTHTCSFCGDSYKDSETPAGDHSYVMTVTKAATCQEKGVAEYKCEHCDASYTEDIPMTDHEYNAVVTEPTCQAGGFTTYTCKHCDASYVSNETPVAEHSYAVSAETPATCKEYSKTTYTCTVCGASYTVEGNKYAAHNYESVVTAPTCTAAGYTTYTCTVCGRSYKDAPTVKLGHEYDEDGFCIRCNASKDEPPVDPPVNPSGLAFNDTATFIINEENKTVLVRKTLTAAELKAAIKTEGWVITTADGTAAADDKAVATAYCIRSEDGSLVYTVAILGDISRDGKVTAADARTALRVTARIDTADAIGTLAADADGSEKLTAMDARIILRVSARIQTF